MTTKDQQIKNYINQLSAEKINYQYKTYTIKDKPKQVWLITRGPKVSAIGTVDHIKIKEVPYTKLIEIYDMRLSEEIGTDELTDLLKDLK
ncbi:hypothetical protein DCC81_01005 [Chitinophaga parva]|uniref:Uncharacterized protein n=1 Tax=Chitinophaga parva TaxID=2169414 RepID=A0A2T7BKA1_9BACT|nr:hypothetical protein [Chitinophaga parva]PUZ28092.1 hypothetical protein DCC81_01005 [Chitinophaga parva]